MNTDAEREIQPRDPSLRDEQQQEHQRPVRVALVHLGQEPEPDQRRCREPEDERPRPRVAHDRGSRRRATAGPSMTKPIWRSVIGPRTATWSEANSRRRPRSGRATRCSTPGATGSGRCRSGRRPGCAGSRPVHRPPTNGSHSDDDDRQPDRRRSGAISRHPPCVQNHAANGSEERQGLRLGHHRRARTTAASPSRPFRANTRAAIANSR